jgi:D-3-phosphoglycerate dehydrogenase
MKLVITEPSHFSAKALQLLNSSFEVVKLKSIKELDKHLDDVEILFIRLGIYFNEQVLHEAKKLKIICSPTTGLDHIDIGFCKAKNIHIISLKGEVDFLGSIPSTAEHAFNLLNAVNRYLYLANYSVSKKIWDRNQFKSYNLHGKTLGLLGLGRVGKQIANYANTFHMKVVAYDVDVNQKQKNVVNLESPEELFIKSDFISIHIPLEKANIKFVNEKLIGLMKTTSCIINTSRGQVWDEVAIVEALINNKIRGIATDVVYSEMEKDVFNSPIFRVNEQKYNCIITPHIAGATHDSMQMTEEFVVTKLLELINE